MSAGRTADHYVSDYLVVQSTFVVVATVLVLVRAYVRTTIVRKFGLDDAVICLALVCITSYCFTRRFHPLSLEGLIQVLYLLTQDRFVRSWCAP